MQCGLTRLVLGIDKRRELLSRPPQLRVPVPEILQCGEEQLDDLYMRILDREMEGRSSGSILGVDVDVHFQQPQDAHPMSVLSGQVEHRLSSFGPTEDSRGGRELLLGAISISCQPPRRPIAVEETEQAESTSKEGGDPK